MNALKLVRDLHFGLIVLGFQWLKCIENIHNPILFLLLSFIFLVVFEIDAQYLLLVFNLFYFL